MDAIAYQLSQILIARRNHDIPADGNGLYCKRAEYIVGFNTFDLQQRPALKLDQLKDRLDLASQFFRHRRTVGLVLFKELVAEILPLGIKNADFAIGRHGLVHRAQHSVEALDGARRLALACGQRRQRVKGSEKVIGTVDKK